MGAALNSQALTELTGYKQPKRQAAWVRRELGLDPPLGVDGRPRLTLEAVTAAMLSRRSTAPKPAPSAGQPKWTRS